MSEWWTYSLSDFLMFSGRTWYRLLELHNTVWSPLHVVTTLAAGWLLFAMRSASPGRLRGALVLAGGAWLFAAWAFHWVRYAPINWGADAFALGFGLQGLALVWQGWTARDLRVGSDLAGRVGQAMLLVATLYPLLALAWGRPLAQSEWFGLMPDPTALATLGMLLCLRRGDAPGRPSINRIWLMLIPLLWCAVTGATLWTLNAGDWFLLPVAGALALGMALRGKGAPAG